MPMKITQFDDAGIPGFEVTVHLDTTKLGADGVTPDPAYLRTWTWGSFESSGNQGETKAQYRQRIKNETKLLAQLERGKLAPTRTSVASMLGDL